LYGIQEGSKTQEYAAKWVCNFCGKAFFSEHYLDKHFDNRHSDKLVKVRMKSKWAPARRCCLKQLLKNSSLLLLLKSSDKQPLSKQGCEMANSPFSSSPSLLI